MEKKEHNLHCDITHAGSRVRPSLQQQVPLGGHKTGRIGTNKKAQGGLFWASTEGPGRPSHGTGRVTGDQEQRESANGQHFGHSEGMREVTQSSGEQ